MAAPALLAKREYLKKTLVRELFIMPYGTTQSKEKMSLAVFAGRSSVPRVGIATRNLCDGVKPIMP